MDFAILGPVEARLDGSEVALGGPKQRALLTVLLLARNEIVSRDRLVEALWGERAPPTVQRSLDSYVSRLRRLLGENRIERRTPGYLLRVEPGELDLDRFDRLLAEARDASAPGDRSRALEALEAALALWRGPALADLLFEPFAGPEAERLEERRLGALEERLGIRLELGEGAELVDELERLVRDQPWRERLIGQLMLALYRAGRQADALAAYRDAQRRFAAELGLEPGSQLRELEQRILAQDPSLSPRGGRRPVASPRRRRRRAGVVTLVAVAAAIAAAVLLAVNQSSEPARGSDATHRLVGVDLRSAKAAAPIPLSGAPEALVVGSGSIWATDSEGQAVARISPESGAVVDRVPVAGQPGSLATGDGAIWVASTLGGAIERIDPATGAVTQTVRLGADNVAAITFSGGSLWAADTTQRSLVEIDPRSGTVSRSLSLDVTPGALVAGRKALWVADFNANLVEQVDSTSGREIATVRAGNGPAALALAGGAVWVANSLDSTVSRIDARTGTVEATLAVGSSPSALAIGGGSIWVASRFSGEVSRIDPRTNRVTATVRVGGRPAALAAGLGRVWAGAAAGGAEHRGGTLRLVTPTPIPTIDPAHANFVEPAQFTRLAYDTLVTFEASPGPAGLRLVPDLALSIPAPSDGDTTYTFRLRRGIRYSDGRPLRAADFRRGVERLFRVGSQGVGYYRGLEGADACVERPESCELPRGIEVDDAAGTVRFHLTEPDPSFPLKLTVFGYSAPIPLGTPDRDVGADAVPGTGPYRFAERTRGGALLVRNRFFREWSHAAQPQGYPDRVVWRAVRSSRAAVDQVRRGRADWILSLLPAEAIHRLPVELPGQLHENPWLLIDFIPLNTHRPPFDDVRARRAFNFAIDRDRIARMYGGSAGAVPTCQTLMPGMLGHRAFCPYSHGGDLERARRLVAASGTTGERVDVWAPTDLLGQPEQLRGYVAGVLRSIGYRVVLHEVPAGHFTHAFRRHIQLSVDGDWLPDYPAPSSYLPQFFGCGGGLTNGYVCNPELDRRMKDAAALELRSPEAAAPAWAAIDREIVRQAYWVPTVNPQEPELVSKRLRNYQFNPVWGFLADQAWLR